MNDLKRLRNVLLAAGYASGLLSLLLPAAEHGKVLIGLECLALSLLSIGVLASTPITTDDIILFLSGLANLWLMNSWTSLLFTNRHVNGVWGMVGYLGFIVALASSTQVDAVYIGYYLWVFSFFLIATGLVIDFMIRAPREAISSSPHEDA